MVSDAIPPPAGKPPIRVRPFARSEAQTTRQNAPERDQDACAGSDRRAMPAKQPVSRNIYKECSFETMLLDYE